MKISQVAEILKANILVEGNMEEEVITACGSDMMSDVLAYVKEQAVLLSGLVNPQVVRTAEMMDIKCIVFVRGKIPGDNVIELAKSMDIAILTSSERMYVACGKLYSNGLAGGSVIEE